MLVNRIIFVALLSALSASGADNNELLAVGSPEGAAAIAAGHCDLAPGSPMVVQQPEGVHFCLAAFSCPRSRIVLAASAGTPALDDKTCPDYLGWAERNKKLAQEQKISAFRTAAPLVSGVLGSFEELTPGLFCRLRKNRLQIASYVQNAQGDWSNAIHSEIECKGKGADLMPPFIACKEDGYAMVDGQELMRGRTIADCWKEENRFPYKANHNNQIKMMSEEDFVAQRKKDRKSNNGLTPSAARVAAGKTATSGGETHEQAAGAGTVSRRPDSVENSLAIAR